MCGRFTLFEPKESLAGIFGVSAAALPASGRRPGAGDAAVGPCSLLRPYPAGAMEAGQVGPSVNNPSNDSRELIAPLR